jgi:hypothetical protein
MSMTSKALDLRPLKAKAADLFPPGHLLRETIQRCPDELPREDAPATIATLYLMARSMKSG